MKVKVIKSNFEPTSPITLTIHKIIWNLISAAKFCTQNQARHHNVHLRTLSNLASGDEVYHQDPAGGDEDAAADDGADDDGDPVEESHLGLQLHLLLPPSSRLLTSLCKSIKYRV